MILFRASAQKTLPLTSQLLSYLLSPTDQGRIGIHLCRLHVPSPAFTFPPNHEAQFQQDAKEAQIVRILRIPNRVPGTPRNPFQILLPNKRNSHPLHLDKFFLVWRAKETIQLLEHLRVYGEAICCMLDHVLRVFLGTGKREVWHLLGVKVPFVVLQNDMRFFPGRLVLQAEKDERSCCAELREPSQ